MIGFSVFSDADHTRYIMENASYKLITVMLLSIDSVGV